MSDATISPTPGVRRTRRRRRPTGAPPPLPRRITPSTTVWLVLAAALVTGAFLISERTPWLKAADQVLVAIAVLGAAVVAAEIAASTIRPAFDTRVAAPACGTGHSMILAAQAVPSSEMLPCIAALPSGWSVGGAEIGNGRSVFWLDSDRAGPRAVTVRLTAACDTSRAVRIPSDQAGAERFERPLSLQPRFMLARMYTFPGGCITYQFSFIEGAAPLLAIPVDIAVAFEPRSDLTRYVRATEDLALCGRGAACPR